MTILSAYIYCFKGQFVRCPFIIKIIRIVLHFHQQNTVRLLSIDYMIQKYLNT